MADFSLKKWYLDCVDKDGDVWIGYCAALRWMGVSFSYSASIRRGRKSLTRSQPGDAAFPVESDGVVRWLAPEVGVSTVELERTSPGVGRELWRSSEGSVTWRCVAPAATGSVKGEGWEMSGTGYAEVLEMTRSPWSLGIEEIRWGRFAAGSSSFVWIDCPGEDPVSVSFQNGREGSLRRVDESAVEATDGTTLLMSETTTIRDESLSGTISTLPALVAKLVPRRLRNAREEKWLSRGRLEVAECSPVAGWVIHERVVFGK